MTLDGTENEEWVRDTLALASGIIHSKWRLSHKLMESIDKLLKGEYSKRGRHMAVVHAGIAANIQEMKNMVPCQVYDHPVDKAHKCQSCDKYVHSIICSKPVGEEGHGQKVLCHLCDPDQPKPPGGKPEDQDPAKENPLPGGKPEDQDPAKENPLPGGKPEDQDPNKSLGKEDANIAAGGDPPKPPESDHDQIKAKSIDTVNEFLKYIADNGANVQQFQDLCNEATQLGNTMSDGIANNRWLLNIDTTRNIDLLLSTKDGTKRASYVKSVLTTLN